MRTFDRRTTGDREREVLRALRVLQGDLGDATHEAMAARLPTFPLKVQIQTSTRCNAACAMCPYPEITSADGFAHEQMSEALYRSVLEQLRGRPIERLSLFLMNEPLVDKRLPAWLAAARDALPATTLNLFTNGSRLTGDVAQTLARAGLDELCVSVHGFDKGVYEAVMKGLSYERLERNLAEVLTLYRSGALGRLEVSVVAGELPEITQSLGSAPAVIREHVLLKAFSNERDVVAVPRKIGSSATPASVANAKVPPLCQRPFVKLYVLANGDCVLCNCDWTRSVVLGRLSTAADSPTIAEIWNGARYNAVRLQLLRNEFAPGLICRRCDYPAVAGFDT